MAAAKKHSRKVSKKSRKSIFCFLGGCFGISNKVSADHHGQTRGKLVKHGETMPVNDQTTTSSDQIICSSREIHVVEAEEEITNDRKVIDNKTHEMLSKNSKIDQVETSSTKQSDLRQKNWVNSIKLSHSMSLPLPRQTKEKVETAAGGGHKGKTGKELILADEFDSMLGALIIMVTLIVMLIWGKVCAILCTAVWFYFIPRLRGNINESYVIKLNNLGTNQVDFDSREYKKNIVLKGLLHRNQHV